MYWVSGREGGVRGQRNLPVTCKFTKDNDFTSHQPKDNINTMLAPNSVFNLNKMSKYIHS